MQKESTMIAERQKIRENLKAYVKTGDVSFMFSGLGHLVSCVDDLEILRDLYVDTISAEDNKLSRLLHLGAVSSAVTLTLVAVLGEDFAEMRRQQDWAWLSLVYDDLLPVRPFIRLSDVYNMIGRMIFNDSYTNRQIEAAAENIEIYEKLYPSVRGFVDTVKEEMERMEAAMDFDHYPIDPERRLLQLIQISELIREATVKIEIKS